jgi:hypothetical protein
MKSSAAVHASSITYTGILAILNEYHFLVEFDDAMFSLFEELEKYYHDREYDKEQQY